MRTTIATNGYIRIERIPTDLIKDYFTEDGIPYKQINIYPGDGAIRMAYIIVRQEKVKPYGESDGKKYSTVCIGMSDTVRNVYLQPKCGEEYDTRMTNKEFCTLVESASAAMREYLKQLPARTYPAAKETEALSACRAEAGQNPAAPAKKEAQGRKVFTFLAAEGELLVLAHDKEEAIRIVTGR